ncbi:MAG: branched-chain amino acid transaminase [Thermoflexales bacterium]|nr:branched-chain amino acid transaminase [Thermoflexales bacterium]
MSLPTWAFFKGQIVPYEQAKVGVMTHTLNYGTGCFEGIRAYWSEDEQQLLVFKLLEHYQRMLRSVRILSYELPYSVEQLCQTTLEILRKEGYRGDAYIRPLVYAADEIIGVKLHDLHVELAIFAVPFGRYVEQEEGAHVCVSSWRRVDDNVIPARAKLTGAYVNSAFIKTEALRNGFDEALVLTNEGHISEGSAENVFVVRDGVVATPPASDNILEGITRAVVIQLMRDELGLTVVERSIDRTEVYVAEEVFFCGTGVQVAAITRVDHRPVGTGSMGPVVQSLRDLYFKVVRGQLPKYRAWCTPVY